MSDIQKRGENLALSARNLLSVGPEIDSMLRAAYDLLVNNFNNSDLELIEEICNGYTDDDLDGEEWLCRVRTCNARIFEVAQGAEGQKSHRRRKKRRGTVSLIARLCGNPVIEREGVDFPWKDQACLFVGWHNVKGSDNGFWGEEHFKVVSGNKKYIRHVKDGLWSWNTDEENHNEEEDVSFFFVLPLFSIQSEKDIKDKVITPLNAFFQTLEPAKIAAEVLKDVPVLTP